MGRKIGEETRNIVYIATAIKQSIVMQSSSQAVRSSEYSEEPKGCQLPAARALTWHVMSCHGFEQVACAGRG